MAKTIKAKIQDYIVLDFETGGLPSKSKLAVLDVAVTEIALVYLNPELEVLDKYNTFVKPYSKTCEYNAIAAEKTGITKELCEREGKEIKSVVEDIKSFIASNKTGKSKPTMVGHNLIEFDSYFMENLFLYCGENLYDYVSKYSLDTLHMSWRLLPENENYQLGTMCKHFGIKLVDSHRALPDTESTAELFKHMMLNMRGSFQGGDSEIEIPRKRNSNQFKF